MRVFAAVETAAKPDLRLRLQQMPMSFAKIRHRDAIGGFELPD